MSWGGHAVVQIPVPELEDWVRERNRFYDAGFVSDDPRFVHAHITVLAPLKQWDETSIGRIAAATQPFRITLDRVDVFPNGIIHLVPTPQAPLRALTRATWAAHPDVVPNGAPDPSPHLTLDALSKEVGLDSTRAALGQMVPVTTCVDELHLVWYESGNCHFIRGWRLGAVPE